MVGNIRNTWFFAAAAPNAGVILMLPVQIVVHRLSLAGHWRVGHEV